MRVSVPFQIGFAAVDAMTGLELIERGVSKDTFALLAIPLTPLEILLPFFVSKYTTGNRPLNLYANSHPCRSDARIDSQTSRYVKYLVYS
jgi:MFS transporter, PAT family, solute carrier family 33 (acetyl-CoA transportor), member 1